MNISVFKIQCFLERRFGPDESKGVLVNVWYELILFGYKNAISCLFPVLIFTTLAVSKLIPLGTLPRYDFLLLACIAIQAVLLITKIETRDELLVICVFHVMGILMECFKVSRGSWSYPEFSYLKVYDVPLYSGFMYASVASYMCQAWRRFELKMNNWPNSTLGWIIAGSVYINFFSQHFIGDFRKYLMGIIIILFFRSKVLFITNNKLRHMPVIVSFLCIGFFIWLAENISTFFGAWKYANQHNGWKLVHYQKIFSWILMSIVSYIIVAQMKFFKNNNL